MNFGFTEQQEQLRAQVQKLLVTESPMPEVRRVAKTDAGYDAALWKKLGELGLLGLLVPEAFGGAGLSWVDAVVLLEATGQALLPSPLLSQLLVTSVIAELGSDEQKRRLLPALARGEQIAAPALFERGRELGPGGVQARAVASGTGYALTGEKTFVADAASAGSKASCSACSSATNPACARSASPPSTPPSASARSRSTAPASSHRTCS